MINKYQVIFVLGGPGSGKGTQCSLIQKKFKFFHLSAGQLLRKEQTRVNSQFGPIIQSIIDTGKIVPSHITISLLLNQMNIIKQKSANFNFLIDGFPRNMQNYNSWNQKTNQLVENPFILHLKCTQNQMLKRLLIRSQKDNRSDDKTDIIKKRFNTYQNETMQVIRQFQKSKIVKHIDADKNIDEIFAQISNIFTQQFRFKVY